MEQELLDQIYRDCQSSICGIKEHDPHLLSLGFERVTSHCTTISNLLNQEDDGDTRSILDMLLQQLKYLRSQLESTLIGDDAANEDMSDICVPLQPAAMLALRKQGMPWSKCGQIFGVSRQTVYNYRRKYGLEEPNADISFADLCASVQDTLKQNPNEGSRLMHGAIRAAGFKVSRAKVQAALREVAPLSVALRRRRTIQRRVYRVKGANYLWHMDSTHKLVMYRIVIHGCIDGFSRRILYVNAASNNVSQTVMTMFQGAVTRCHFPKRVRADRGSENVLVEKFVAENSEASNPFIYGRSVHNTRIERLWRDVNEQVTFVYKHIFKSLEEIGDLDENNYLDIFLLHYVFIQRIQVSLLNFCLHWNNHCMDNLCNKTPTQAWTISMMKQGLCNPSADCPNLFDEFNMEENSLNGNDLFLPDFADHIREELLAKCMRIVPDPLAEDGDEGKNHYLALKSYFNSYLIHSE